MAVYCEEMKIWDGIPHYSRKSGSKEHRLDIDDGNDRLTDVSSPNITFYPCSEEGPAAQRKHPAVLVFPDGGYIRLAWSHGEASPAGFLMFRRVKKLRRWYI